MKRILLCLAAVAVFALGCGQDEQPSSNLALTRTVAEGTEEQLRDLFGIGAFVLGQPVRSPSGAAQSVLHFVGV